MPLLGLVAALVDLSPWSAGAGRSPGCRCWSSSRSPARCRGTRCRWLLFAFAAAGFLILLALDSSDDLHRWGHFVPRTDAAGAAQPPAISGQRIAAVGDRRWPWSLPLFLPSDSRNLRRNVFHNGSDNGGTGFGPRHGGPAASTRSRP